ncbi:MAG: ABC transporter permease [[Clostridium] innocuum]
MRQARILSSAFLLFLLWWLLAVWMDNDFIIPYPLDVLKLMGAQLQSAAFYQSTLVTLLRSWGGLLAAFVLAGWCAFLSYRMPAFHDLFYPILLLTRSVPNISYIIVILLWFGSESSAAIVSFLIIFPTIYSSLYSGLQHMDENLKRVVQLYPESRWYLLRRVYLPLLSSSIQASLSNGISLTFKVGVMSEIMGQVPHGDRTADEFMQADLGYDRCLCMDRMDYTDLTAYGCSASFRRRTKGLKNCFENTFFRN